MFDVALQGEATDRSALVDALNAEGAVGSLRRPFEIGQVGRAGTGSVVGRVGEASDAVGVLLSAVRSRRWAGALVVAAETGPDASSSAGGPQRMRDAARAVERAAHRSGRTAVVLGADLEGRAAADPHLAADLRMVEAALDLVAVLEARRSVPQQAAGRLVDAGLSQREAAAELGVSQQAVHSRLRHGFWNETRLVLDGLLPVLGRLGRTGE